MPAKVKKRLDEICDLIPENHLFTKTYINSHKGKYPVYSATLGEPYGYIDTYAFEDKKVLVVVNYGNSGSTYIINEPKFSIGRNICGLYVKDEYVDSISLEYVMIVATPLLLNKAKGEKQKNLNQIMVKETVISFPVDDKGDFDYDKQVEMAETYKGIFEKKKALQAKIEELDKICVKVNQASDIKFKNVKLNDLFEPKGGNMLYSKKWCNEHAGEFAIYSANTSEVFAYVDDVKYDGEYLTWVIDGLAGYMKIINEKFDITCHRGILIPKVDLKDISLEYIKYVLEPSFREKRRGRIGINGKNEYTALKPTHIKNFDFSIPIPIKNDDSFDLEAQNEIAKHYKTIDTIKSFLKDKTQELLEIIVEA